MSTPFTHSAAEILFETRGGLGLVTLNRPRQLNALTLGMVRALQLQLEAWAKDSAIKAVAIHGAGGKAFCAGGDIRKLYEQGMAGDLSEPRAFWREEYTLNRFIKRYPKPYIALIDGIVMGGGVGLSLHGSHRAASESYLFAMPEAGIGFFPDVGATYAMPRLPGAAGIYLCVTGARIGAADALALGLATHHVPAARFPALLGALADGMAPDRALASLSQPPGVAALDANRAVIHAAFSRDTVAAVLQELDRLAGQASEFASATAKLMRAKSPSSMAIALEQMRRGVSMTFEEAMITEFRIVSRIAVRNADFYEGVRAAIIDKDNSPRWNPAAVAAVTPERVASFFAPLADDLEFGALQRS